MKKHLGPKDILFPIPASIVVSGSTSDANIATVAWVGIMGSNPPTIAISLKQDRYTLKLIKEHNEFSVNIPSAKSHAEVDYCGLVSGESENKFHKTGFTPIQGEIIKTPLIKECPYNIECVVDRIVDVGEWSIVIGQIVETHIDADKYENDTIDITKVDPLVYCSTIREYWSIGNKIGDSFSDGLDLYRETSNKLDKDE